MCLKSRCATHLRVPPELRVGGQAGSDSLTELLPRGLALVQAQPQLLRHGCGARRQGKG